MERNFRPLLSMKGKPHEPPRAPPHREAWQMINRMLLIAILAAVLTYGAVDIALRLEQNRSAAIAAQETEDARIDRIIERDYQQDPSLRR